MVSSSLELTFLAPLLVGIDVGEYVFLHFQDRALLGAVVQRLLTGPKPLGTGQLLAAELLRPLAGDRCQGRAEQDAEMEVRNAELVVGQQDGPANARAVDARAVGAPQIANQQDPV